MLSQFVFMYSMCTILCQLLNCYKEMKENVNMYKSIFGHEPFINLSF